MQVITVAAAIIVNEQQQLLVVRKHNTQCFMQVGGKLEPNEVPEHTMLREIREEIGGEAQIKQFVGCFETATANEPDFRLISYVYHVELEQAPQIAAEIAEMKWLDLTDQQTALAPLTTEVILPWVRQYFVVEAV